MCSMTGPSPEIWQDAARGRGGTAAPRGYAQSLLPRHQRGEQPARSSGRPVALR